METLIDELAARAKIDPIAYRLRLLAPGARKQRAALTLLQQQSGWRNKLPRGHAMGIACSQYHDTGRRVRGRGLDRGQAAEDPIAPTVTSICGLAVNPLSIESQVSGRDRFRPDAADGETGPSL